jgi:UDP-2,3-diacylglucosamine pyrophosphatase LpxH
MRHEYRTLWLSDIHLGTSASRAADLLAFLDKVSAEVIYLAGDLVDFERMKCRPVFPLLHQRVVGRRWSADTVIAKPRPAAESLAA